MFSNDDFDTERRFSKVHKPQKELWNNKNGSV